MNRIQRKKEKKRAVVFTALLLILTLSVSLLFTACGNTVSESEPAGSAEVESTSKPENTPAESSSPQEAAVTETQSGNSAETPSAGESSQSDDSAAGAGTAQDPAQAGQDSGSASSGTNAALSEAPELSGLTAESVLPLSYATCYNVFYYSDGFKLIDIPSSAQYLVIPEGAEAPDGLDRDIVRIYEPLDSIYLAATSAMALFDAIDAIGAVTMSGNSEGAWYIDAPLKAIEAGTMVYAGKYSEPDYEKMIALDCDLAIESTMILHTPEVQEMIEDLGIPVLIDRSAYETGALGRTEWVKLYGALMDRDDEANAFFAEQEELIGGLDDFPNTGKTVAYFSINTDGSVVVRTNNDYIPGMIDLAGGIYLFDGVFPGVKASTQAISMEQFYAAALDADYLIYNATIEDALGSLDELVAKDSVLADLKAVEEGNVWQIGKMAYQSTDRLANLILDFHNMLVDGDESEMIFLTKLK